jgi:DNA polymerase-3 subunit alpha
MATDFVHLHLHTDYSLLDGACAISWAKLKKEDAEGKVDLVTMAQEYGMKACAITDHGVMGGCYEFHNAMKKAGIKPIIGCETYIAPGSRLEKQPGVPNIKGFHLILLAKNNVGYHNLCKLNSEAHMTGFYYKPRIDRELLAKYHEGIIGMSACLQGEIDVAILRGGVDAGRKVLFEYLDLFGGKENFCLEIMYHGIEDQKTVNRGLIQLARENDIRLVATNDVHYLKKEHAHSHEIMLCIQTRTTMDDPRRMKMDFDEFYFKSGDEMMQVFGTEAPDAITNTLAIAEQCDVTIGYENHYPEFTPPQEFVDTLDLDAMRAESEQEIDAEIAKAHEEKPDDPLPSEDKRANLIERRIVMKKSAAYLRNICLYGTGRADSVCGYEKKYGYDPFNPPEDKKKEAETNLKRMDYELSIITRTKYPSYFLCVWDFINWAKEHGIPVGPGRGSGAGSIVAYLSGITNIDPMKYDLLFERFLNPDRVSPPDFDTDFCERHRQEVIDYVIGKYGADSVSQIGTYGTLKAKAVVKDVARVLGRTPAEGNMITKLIPDDPKMTLAKAVKDSPELKQLLEKEAWVREIFQYCAPIEQLNRQMGIHACGVIICNQPLADLVPLGRGAHEEVITQYVAPLCESIGLLKMDFLGLRTLTVIQDAVDNVKRTHGISLDMDAIPLDDPKTYELINRGDTVSVFQLESGGMQDLCRKFGVENLLHIIALVALYRPGPMQFLDLFVGRKKGTIPIDYDHPLMEQYLKETYGIMLYQEQIMQVVQVLAGFSLGQADILRRAIGKKKIKDMEAQHDKFVEGCAKTNKIPAAQAEKIWENIKKFAEYGFNKSHSAAYALLSYRTAYLKANYRPEFMAAVLTSELSNAKKLTFLINECRTTGIRILPPDVNTSDVNFTVDGGAIRFGLGAIKGFGQGISAVIIEARKDGPFTSLSDLAERTEGLNAKGLEALIRCGALDSTGLKRAQLMAMIDSALTSAAAARRDRESGQASLFDMLDDPQDAGFEEQPPPDIPEFPESVMLEDEKQLLGFYVSGHPLSSSKKIIDTFSTANLAEISRMPGDVGVKFGGLVTSVVKKYTKNDKNPKPFAVVQIEDLTDTIECVCYNRLYTEVASILVEGAKVFVRAVTKKDDVENAEVSLQIEDLIPLEDAMVFNSGTLQVNLFEDGMKPDTCESLRALLARHTTPPPELFPEEPASSEPDSGDFAPKRKKAKTGPAPVPVLICAATKTRLAAFIELPDSLRVYVTKSLLDELDALLGENHYTIKPNDDVPQPRKPWRRDKDAEPASA